jgi:hypothetical protein
VTRHYLVRLYDEFSILGVVVDATDVRVTDDGKLLFTCGPYIVRGFNDDVWQSFEETGVTEEDGYESIRTR